MTDAKLEDRILIREVYGRYAIAVAQQDAQAWLDCWSSTATWKTPHFEVTGIAALEQSWDATWSGFVNVAAFNEVGSIAVADGTASAVSSVLEIITLKAGGTLKMAGVYTDSFVRENGQWRFSHREYAPLSQEMSASQAT